MKRPISTYLFVFTMAFSLQAQLIPEKKAELANLFTKGSNQLYVNKDSAYFYFEAAEKLALQLDDKGTLLDIFSYWTFASDYHYDLQTYLSSLKKTEALLGNDALQAEVEDYETYQNLYLLDRATYYYKTMENGLALSSLRQLLAKLETIPPEELDEQNASTLFSTYNYLASLHKRTGNYDLAEQFYQKALAFLEENGGIFDNPEDYITGTQQLIAQLYSMTGAYQKAEQLFLKTLEVNHDKYKRHKIYRNSLVTAYLEISKNYIAMNSPKKAIEYLNKGQDFLVANDPFYKKSELTFGDAYLRMGQNQKAHDSYNSALQAFQRYRQKKPHQDIADVYGKIASLYLKQKNYQEGLKTLQKAFNAAGDTIQIKGFNRNPDPANVFSKTQLLHLLDVKIQLLQGSYEDTADTTYQQACLQTSRDILKTFDLLKSEFDSKLDKQFLADKAYPIFHRLMETTHKAYVENATEENLQLALNIAEKNKDFILLEALRNAQATKYGNVPQKILEKEAQLRAEITSTEKRIFDATATESGFSDKLFKLKQEYYGFLDTIKINYPKYHELKYQNVGLDLGTVREDVLDDNGTLVSYTMTEDYLYAIVLDGSKEDFLKLPFSDADRNATREFYKLLSNPSINNSQKAISDLGKDLYDKTLKKPLEGFNTQNLTIIPDGELHYLPFDLLQKNGSYLLQTTAIGYGNSVTSLLELMAKRKSEKNNILAFAPIFDGAAIASTDREFGKLLYNDDEVSKIGAFYDTETVIDDKATLANFKAKTSEFNVLHLATHASANDEYPDYSYLAFTQTKDSTESNILYIKDLYDMSLNADMVTLSACQTGIGKLQKGQGMLSLSKGFYYAGAKSLVNTLWKINDKSTVKLMEYFYKGLSEGKSKKEALRDAKMKYLKTTDDNLLKHPYYWAAFTVSGDTAPLQNADHKWSWLLFLPIVVFGAWIVQRKSQSN